MHRNLPVCKALHVIWVSHPLRQQPTFPDIQLRAGRSEVYERIEDRVRSAGMGGIPVTDTGGTDLQSDPVSAA